MLITSMRIKKKCLTSEQCKIIKSRSDKSMSVRISMVETCKLWTVMKLGQSCVYGAIIHTRTKRDLFR